MGCHPGWFVLAHPGDVRAQAIWAGIGRRLHPQVFWLCPPTPSSACPHGHCIPATYRSPTPVPHSHTPGACAPTAMAPAHGHNHPLIYHPFEAQLLALECPCNHAGKTRAGNSCNAPDNHSAAGMMPSSSAASPANGCRSVHYGLLGWRSSNRPARMRVGLGSNRGQEKACPVAAHSLPLPADTRYGPTQRLNLSADQRPKRAVT